MIFNINSDSQSLQNAVGYDSLNFGQYLQNPGEIFSVDLSHANLLEAIHKMIEIRIRLYPTYDKQYRNLIRYLKCMEKEFNCILYPSHVTDIFWSNFIPYLTQKGLSLSTVKTLCCQLKASIEWAGKHHARIAESYNMIKIPEYRNQQIALTIDEISHIAHFDVGTIKRRPQYIENLAKVRDMFVLSCNLGQRHSDMVRIDKTCFNKNIFTIVQQKTGNRAKVDIDKMSMDKNTTYRLLEKYNYMAPKPTDISVYDRYLKQLLVYIGKEFLEPVKREVKVNGFVETKMIPKYKLISSHTARRSFVTNNVLRGHTPLEIMRASGHKDYMNFEKYLCYFDDL